MLVYAYLFCLVLGGVLLGASILLGGHDDADLGGDGSFDADADLALDADADLALDADADFEADAHGAMDVHSRDGKRPGL
ncbi:MAG: hypothetical protein OEY14_11300, partial [Myxococcales bacterium]|nr:hypothetical protein [Myxococcales bacterium]